MAMITHIPGPKGPAGKTAFNGIGFKPTSNKVTVKNGSNINMNANSKRTRSADVPKVKYTPAPSPNSILKKYQND